MSKANTLSYRVLRTEDIIIHAVKNKHLETPPARSFILLLMRFSYRLELLQAECCHYK